MLLAQITDLHMRRDDTPMSGEVITRPYIEAAVAAINTWSPDAVFITGDLTDIGSTDEYAMLRTALDRLTSPYYLIPGNHDRHANLRATFDTHAYLQGDGPANWIVDDFPVRLIGLDSVVPGKSHGTVAAETLTWLDDALSASDKPTIVGLHHPPFPTGIPGMDGINCLNGPELADVIRRHPHVERVIAGHHHRPIQIRWAGTLGQIAPSVAHQVVLDFSERKMAEWVLEPPAMQLYRWTAESGVISHMAYINDYGGPRSFSLDPDYPGDV